MMLATMMTTLITPARVRSRLSTRDVGHVTDELTGIATQGSGNIAAVAPGIGEALMATAAALAVAIPAVFGYNIFANRVNRLDSELEGFGSELIALMVREGRI